MEKKPVLSKKQRRRVGVARDVLTEKGGVSTLRDPLEDYRAVSADGA